MRWNFASNAFAAVLPGYGTTVNTEACPEVADSPLGVSIRTWRMPVAAAVAMVTFALSVVPAAFTTMPDT